MFQLYMYCSLAVAYLAGKAFSADESFNCPEAKGQFADPKDCAYYYNCWDGAPVERQKCQTGLLFDSTKGYCNWKKDVPCNVPSSSNTKSHETQPVTKTSTVASNVTGVSYNYTSSAAKLFRQSHLTNLNRLVVPGYGQATNPAQYPASPGSPCRQSTGQFVDPKDCNSYYNCWKGDYTHFKCGAGFYFDERVNYCQQASQVPCSANAAPVAPSPTNGYIPAASSAGGGYDVVSTQPSYTASPATTPLPFYRGPVLNAQNPNQNGIGGGTYHAAGAYPVDTYATTVPPYVSTYSSVPSATIPGAYGVDNGNGNNGYGSAGGNGNPSGAGSGPSGPILPGYGGVPVAHGPSGNGNPGPISPVYPATQSPVPAYGVPVNGQNPVQNAAGPNPQGVAYPSNNYATTVQPYAPLPVATTGTYGAVNVNNGNGETYGSPAIGSGLPQPASGSVQPGYGNVPSSPVAGSPSGNGYDAPVQPVYTATVPPAPTYGGPASAQYPNANNAGAAPGGVVIPSNSYATTVQPYAPVPSNGVNDYGVGSGTYGNPTVVGATLPQPAIGALVPGYGSIPSTSVPVIPSGSGYPSSVPQTVYTTAAPPVPAYGVQSNPNQYGAPVGDGGYQPNSYAATTIHLLTSTYPTIPVTTTNYGNGGSGFYGGSTGVPNYGQQTPAVVAPGYIAPGTSNEIPVNAGYGPISPPAYPAAGIPAYGGPVNTGKTNTLPNSGPVGETYSETTTSSTNHYAGAPILGSGGAYPSASGPNLPPALQGYPSVTTPVPGYAAAGNIAPGNVNNNPGYGSPGYLTVPATVAPVYANGGTGAVVAPGVYPGGVPVSPVVYSSSTPSPATRTYGNAANSIYPAQADVIDDPHSGTTVYVTNNIMTTIVVKNNSKNGTKSEQVGYLQLQPVLQKTASFKCPEPTGLFADPNDCSGYMNCWNGRWSRMSCGGGSVFDEASQSCSESWNTATGCRMIRPDSPKSKGRQPKATDSESSELEKEVTTKPRIVNPLLFAPQRMHPQVATIFPSKATTVYERSISDKKNAGNRDQPTGGYSKAGLVKRSATNELDDSDFICPTPQGLFPHDTDCTSFWNCGEGWAYLQPCPKPLVFDFDSQRCQWSGGECINGKVVHSAQHRPATQSTKAPVKVSSVNKAVHPHNPHQPSNHHRGPQQDKKNKFNCPTPSGFFSDPTDCSKFFQCVSHVAYHYGCPSGLNFNPVNHVCDWPDRFVCGNGASQHRPFTFKCPVPNGRFNHPEQDGSYFVCEHGVAHLRQCQPDHTFVANRRVCMPNSLLWGAPTTAPTTPAGKTVVLTTPVMPQVRVDEVTDASTTPASVTTPSIWTISTTVTPVTSVTTETSTAAVTETTITTTDTTLTSTTGGATTTTTPTATLTTVTTEASTATATTEPSTVTTTVTTMPVVTVTTEASTTTITEASTVTTTGTTTPLTTVTTVATQAPTTTTITEPLTGITVASTTADPTTTVAITSPTTPVTVAATEPTTTTASVPSVAVVVAVVNTAQAEATSSPAPQTTSTTSTSTETTATVTNATEAVTQTSITTSATTISQPQITTNADVLTTTTVTSPAPSTTVVVITADAVTTTVDATEPLSTSTALATTTPVAITIVPVTNATELSTTATTGSVNPNVTTEVSLVTMATTTERTSTQPSTILTQPTETTPVTVHTTTDESTSRTTEAAITTTASPNVTASDNGIESPATTVIIMQQPESTTSGVTETAGTSAAVTVPPITTSALDTTTLLISTGNSTTLTTNAATPIEVSIITTEASGGWVLPSTSDDTTSTVPIQLPPNSIVIIESAVDTNSTNATAATENSTIPINSSHSQIVPGIIYTLVTDSTTPSPGLISNSTETATTVINPITTTPGELARVVGKREAVVGLSKYRISDDH